VEALLPTNAGRLDIVAIANDPQGWLVSSYTGSPVAMRRAGIVVAILAVVGAVGAGDHRPGHNVVIGGAQQAANMAFANLNCNAGLGPFVGADAATGAAEAARLAPDQQSTVSAIISVGKQRNLPALAWQVAIQAGMQESTLHNLPGGDRDSAGIFQMRPSQGWGHLRAGDRPDVRGEQVLRRADRHSELAAAAARRRGPARRAVGVPLAYHKWESMAAFLVQHIGQVADPTGCGSGTRQPAAGTTQAAAAAITFALGQARQALRVGRGRPGHLRLLGPVCCGPTRRAGSRCPGWPPISTTGARCCRCAPPNRVISCSSPTTPTTHHDPPFFMYLGNNQLVEAFANRCSGTTGGDGLEQPQLVQQAVRPGV